MGTGDEPKYEPMPIGSIGGIHDPFAQGYQQANQAALDYFGVTAEGLPSRTRNLHGVRCAKIRGIEIDVDSLEIDSPREAPIDQDNN